MSNTHTHTHAHTHTHWSVHRPSNFVVNVIFVSAAVAISDFSDNFGATRKHTHTHTHTLTKKWKYTENQNLPEDPALIYIDQLISL